jgi:hypothetical protein
LVSLSEAEEQEERATLRYAGMEKLEEANKDERRSSPWGAAKLMAEELMAELILACELEPAGYYLNTILTAATMFDALRVESNLRRNCTNTLLL